MKKGLRHSDTHYENYQALIDKWFDEQRSFCLDMAKSSAKFNPFREAAIAKGLMPAPTIPMRLP